MIRVEMAVKNKGNIENLDTGFKKPAHGTGSGIKQKKFVLYFREY
jgi:hypothetical protein